MVWTNSQHQCSSIEGHLASLTSACAAMSILDDGGAAAASACDQPALGAGDRSDGDGEPTAAQASTPAAGEAAARAEAAPLPPPGGAGSSGDLSSFVGVVTASAKSIVAEIHALKEQQKEAREKRSR